MNPICLSIVLYLVCSFTSYATSSDNAEAILIETITLREAQQQLKAHLNEKQKKEITLIGQVRAVSIPTQSDSKVVQVVWTGIKSKEKKKVLFKEPLISTFKSDKGILSKGLKISLYGNKAHLSDAIKRLEKGEDEQGNAELKADNPSSNERRLEDLEGSTKMRSSKKNPWDFERTGENISSQNPLSLLPSKEGIRGSSYSSESNSKSAASFIRQPSHSQHQLSARGSGNSLRRTNGRGDHLNGHPSSISQLSAINNGHKDSSKRGIPLSLNPFPDFEGRGDKNFDPLKMTTIEGLEGDKFKMPHIEVEFTKEGCRPRIDLKRGKVIVQTRSITRKDGVLISETPCTDSDLIFDIKKDYGCCSDKVNESQRVAYTTFRRYYLDEEYNKVYVDADCLQDESQPHPFIDEPGQCRHEIHLPSRLAYPQVETVYYDRSNARQVVKGCHRSGAQPLPIISTAKGCPLKHLFEERRSLVQKKEIFVDQGVTHEVVPCHETEESLPHQFVTSGCKPSLLGTHVTRMVKRQVVHQGRKQLITDRCEPEVTTELLMTREGCEGQYTHDFEVHRSYPHAKYYYLKGIKRKYLEGGCQRSNEPLLHQIKVVGYEHRDDLLKSKPRYQISIHDKNKDLILQERTENNEQAWIPYTLSQEVERPSTQAIASLNGTTLSIPRDKVQIWLRPDKTTYEKVAGLSNSIVQEIPKPSVQPQATIIKNSNTLIQNKPGRTVVQVTHEYAQIPYQVGMKGSLRKITYHYPGVRDVTHYSDGTKTYGNWRKDVK